MLFIEIQEAQNALDTGTIDQWTVSMNVIELFPALSDTATGSYRWCYEFFDHRYVLEQGTFLHHAKTKKLRLCCQQQQQTDKPLCTELATDIEYRWDQHTLTFLRILHPHPDFYAPRNRTTKKAWRYVSLHAPDAADWYWVFGRPDEIISRLDTY